MNIAVRYYTRSGNTKKLAEAIAGAVGVKAEATENALAEEEFYCKGSFGPIHKGKPDEKDCKNAAAFAKKIVGKKGV